MHLVLESMSPTDSLTEDIWLVFFNARVIFRSDWSWCCVYVCAWTALGQWLRWRWENPTTYILKVVKLEPVFAWQKKKGNTVNETRSRRQTLSASKREQFHTDVLIILKIQLIHSHALFLFLEQNLCLRQVFISLEKKHVNANVNF